MDIVIPANNEENYISICLDKLLEQDIISEFSLHVVVACNACTDNTFKIACEFEERFRAKGWSLSVIDLVEPGKPGALNAGDSLCTSNFRMYLDADIECGPKLVQLLYEALSEPRALYATGKLRLAPSKSWVTRTYGRFWSKTPFVQAGAVGAGLYAVNQMGRERWQEFPKIISDDSYVRLLFSSVERVEVSEFYCWPLVEGLRALIRVRRRQDSGMNQLKILYPDLMANEEKPKWRLSAFFGDAAKDPLACITYLFVSLAVRVRGSKHTWARGRQ